MHDLHELKLISLEHAFRERGRDTFSRVCEDITDSVLAIKCTSFDTKYERTLPHSWQDLLPETDWPFSSGTKSKWLKSSHLTHSFRKEAAALVLTSQYPILSNHSQALVSILLMPVLRTQESYLVGPSQLASNRLKPFRQVSSNITVFPRPTSMPWGLLCWRFKTKYLWPCLPWNLSRKSIHSVWYVMVDICRKFCEIDLSRIMEIKSRKDPIQIILVYQRLIAWLRQDFIDISKINPNENGLSSRW